MKKTREKILDTALKLFNRYGLNKVTLRAIAQEMGISQGNLNYHFRKREDIIEILYFQLVEEIDRFFLKIENPTMDIQGLLLFLDHIMNSFYEYRFFLLDFAEILRDNADIRKHYQENSLKRERMVMSAFKDFCETGIFLPESFEGEYVLLYKRVHILIDFWMSHAQSNGQRITRNERKEYFRVISTSIYPYLTEKGKEKWEKAIH